MPEVIRTKRSLLLKEEDRIAEIAPLPGFSKETLDEALSDLTNVLTFGAHPTLPSVRFGLECLKKKLVPFHLPLSSLGVKEGFSTCKVKLGGLSVQEAIELVKKHYKTKRLRLDCNRKWTLEQALEFAIHFEPHDFDYFEEPVESFSDLVAFSKKTHMPIAIDEHFHFPWDQVPTLTTIVVKPTITGFVPKTDKYNVVLSSSYESGVGLRHIARLAVEHNLKAPIGLDTYDPEEDPIDPRMQCANGVISWNT